MGKIYIGQTALIIRLNTKIDLTNALTVEIKYIEPDGTTGTWTATVYNIKRGLIQYIPTSTSILDKSGEWTVWSYITFIGGTIAPGEPDKFTVNVEGT